MAAGRLARKLPTTGDAVAVLRNHVGRWHEVAGPREVQEQARIVGLIPAADNVTDPEMRQALVERAALIEKRA